MHAVTALAHAGGGELRALQLRRQVPPLPRQEGPLPPRLARVVSFLFLDPPLPERRPAPAPAAPAPPHGGAGGVGNGGGNGGPVRAGAARIAQRRVRRDHHRTRR